MVFWIFGKSHFLGNFFEKTQKKSLISVSFLDPGHIFLPTAVKIGISTPLGALQNVFFGIFGKSCFSGKKSEKTQKIVEISPWSQHLAYPPPFPLAVAIATKRPYISPLAP